MAVVAATCGAGRRRPAAVAQTGGRFDAPEFRKRRPAVVLWDESRIAVDEDGRVITTNYYAVKILTRDGRDEARASEVYNTDTGKVREMRAWLIRPSGEVKKYGKGETLDMAIVDNDIYNEVRRRAIMARSEAEPGAIFGYEATVEDRSVFTQFEWGFQHQMPSLVSRVTLALPKGWRAEGVTFNHAKVEPVVNGSTYTWEMRDLPYIEDEPLGPAITNIVPRLAMSYFARWGKPVSA